MGTIFVAGIYGVGKSILCNKLSKYLSIPEFSASNLISSVNKEKYGREKAVSNMSANQNILASQVKECLKTNSNILLTGHFCIFDKNNNVCKLTESVFYELKIEKILLLEASPSKIIENLRIRDDRQYLYKDIKDLKSMENDQAYVISKRLNCPLYIHYMQYNDIDVNQCVSFIEEDLT